MGYIKGFLDGSLAKDLLYQWRNDHNIVETTFDATLSNIIGLPMFYGDPPIIPPGEHEIWRNLCEHLGEKALEIAPIAGLTVGLAGGAIISSIYRYIKDRKILKEMKKILTSADYSEAKKFTRLKRIGYIIKSLGLGLIAYFVIKLVYSFISILLGLNDVPKVIETVEEANFWAKYVYNTVKLAENTLPMTEKYFQILTGGAAAAYGSGMMIEGYGDKKILEILREI